MASIHELCGPGGENDAAVSGNQKILVVREVGYCGSGRWERVGHVQSFTPPTRAKRESTYTEYGLPDPELTIRTGIDEGELSTTVTLYRNDHMVFQLEKDFDDDVNWNYAYVIGGRHAYPFQGYIRSWQWQQPSDNTVSAVITWNIERRMAKFEFIP